jgi:hypothetical protein
MVESRLDQRYGRQKDISPRVDYPVSSTICSLHEVDHCNSVWYGEADPHYKRRFAYAG